MNKYQEELLNIYKILDVEFSKINLKWYAFAGTLLGAVRNQGIIPWDDDIDMLMKHSDIIDNLEKIREIAEKNELDVVSYTDHVDKDIMRIYSRKNITVEIKGKEFTNRPFIDIHPMKTKRGNEKLLLITIASSISGTPSMVIGEFKNSFPLKQTKNIMKKFSRATGSFLMPKKLLKAYVTRRLNKEDEGDMFVPVYNLSYTNKFENDLSKTIRIPFEDHSIEVPANYMELLEMKFGDWKKVPETEYFPLHIINWEENKF